MLRQSFTDFIFVMNMDGSGKAASYIRALDMLVPILTKHYPKPIVGGSMCHSFSLAVLHAVLPRVPYGHHMLTIDKCHSQPEKVLFYVRRTIQDGWSRDVQSNRLSTDRYERESNKILPRGLLGYDVLCLSMSGAARCFCRGQVNGKVVWQKM